MPYTESGFEWEMPAHVLKVIDGRTFLADCDLGFGVHIRARIVVEGIEVDPITKSEGMAARKLAQKLLHDADVYLRTRKIITTALGQVAVAQVAYSPYHTLPDEHASFEAAMLASGHARKEPNG